MAGQSNNAQTDRQNSIYDVMQTVLNTDEFELSYLRLNFTAETYYTAAQKLKELHAEIVKFLPDEVRTGLREELDKFVDDAVAMRRFIERLKTAKT